MKARAVTLLEVLAAATFALALFAASAYVLVGLDRLHEREEAGLRAARGAEAFARRLRTDLEALRLAAAARGPDAEALFLDPGAERVELRALGVVYAREAEGIVRLEGARREVLRPGAESLWALPWQGDRFAPPAGPASYPARALPEGLALLWADGGALEFVEAVLR